MPTTSVTLTQTQTYTLNTVQSDSSGNPLTTPDPTYGAPVYTTSNPSVASVGPLLPLRVVPTGVIGTAAITATSTSSDSTKPAITGVLDVTITGEAAAGLIIGGTIVGT